MSGSGNFLQDIASPLLRVWQFGVTIFSPPVKHKRPGFFEEDPRHPHQHPSGAKRARLSASGDENSQHNSPEVQHPARPAGDTRSSPEEIPYLELRLAHPQSPPGSIVASPFNGSSDATHLDGLSSSTTSKKRRRVSGPLEEMKRREDEQAFEKLIEADATPPRGSSSVGKGAPHLEINETAERILGSSSLSLTGADASSMEPPVPREQSNEQRVGNAMKLLNYEYEQALQNCTISSTQHVQQVANLSRIGVADLSSLSLSHAASPSSTTVSSTVDRRRSLGPGSVPKLMLEEAPLRAPASAASGEHLISPRPLSEVVQLRNKVLMERAAQRTEEIAKMHAKLLLLAKSRETADEALQKQVEERIAAARAKKAEEKAELKALSTEEEARLKAVLGGRNENEVLVSAFNIDIHRSDLRLLCDKEWLNDELVNFYLELLKERERKRASDPQRRLPTCHFFNTFFYAKLAGPNGYDYAAVRRWTTRAKVDIFQMDKIIIPIHLPVHWCTAVINFKKKRFEYYDSLGGSNPECISFLKRYLQDEWKDKAKPGQLDLSDWETYVPKNIPMQQNGYDCGVFCCKFSDSCAQDKPFLFTQRDMPLIRRRLMLQLLDKTAL